MGVAAAVAGAQQQGGAPSMTPMSLSPSVSLAAKDPKAFLAASLAKAQELEKEHEAYEATMQISNPAAARAYMAWQQGQTQAAQQEQIQTTNELKTQVMALQQQLEQTQHLLQINVDNANKATQAANDATTKMAEQEAKKKQLFVPPQHPSQFSKNFNNNLFQSHADDDKKASGGSHVWSAMREESKSTDKSGVSQQDKLPAELVADQGVAAPNSDRFFYTEKAVQPDAHTVSVFFFTQERCSGDFTWFIPPPASMTWSVGSWMSADQGQGGTVQSIMVCNNLDGFQRIFQATVFKEAKFQSDRADHLFYAYPGQCVCSAKLADVNAENLGSWKLAQI